MLHNCSVSGMSGLGSLCGSVGLWALLGMVSGVLTFSLCWNLLCCFQKLSSGRGRVFLPRFRRSISLKDMEDNPIYGNITYTQTRDRKEERSPRAPSSGRECYANLTLKVPRAASGRSSPVPQIQYSDVITVSPAPEDPEHNEEENAMETDTCSLLSDLYASVDADHVKNKKQENNEPYANNV